MRVVFWTNDMVMMFGAAESGVDDQIAPWPKVLPGLLAQPPGVIDRWYLGCLNDGGLIEVPRAFAEALAAGDTDEMIRQVRSRGRRVALSGDKAQV